MNYLNRDPAWAADEVAEISKWLDAHNGHRHPEAVTWGRLSKGAEEQGEVVAAYIALTGQNPRKGMTGNAADVVAECLDLALTALGNVEHLTGNRGESLRMLEEHIHKTHARLRLQMQPDPLKEAMRQVRP